MQRIAFIVGLALVGCATTYGGATPRPVVGEQDTYRFKVYVNSGVGDETALAALRPELEAFRSAKGYGAYKVTSRFFDQNGYDFTIKFSR